MRLLDRPDKLDSREAFHEYVGALARSLQQALANPSSPYGPAADDQGVTWENTRLDHFLGSMDAWMKAVGWTPIDRRESPVWRALSASRIYAGDEAALAQYLGDLRDWAADPNLPPVQEWAAAGEAPRAGRSYE